MTVLRSVCWSPALLKDDSRRLFSRIAILLAGVLLIATTASALEAQQQAPSVALRPMGTVEGVTSVDHFCTRPVMDSLLGEPIAEASGKVPNAVNGYSLFFLVTSEDGKTREPLYLAVYSFQDIRFVLNLGPRILEQFDIPRTRAVLKEVRACTPIYTAGPKASHPHANLLAIGQVQTAFGPRRRLVPVAALFVGHEKPGAAKAAPAPPPVAALPAPDAPKGAPRSDDNDAPGKGTPGVPDAPGGRGLGSGGSGDQPSRSGAAAPKQGPAPQPPVAAQPAPPKAPRQDPPPPPAAAGSAPSAPKADAAPTTAAQLLEEQTALCAKGDQIACMIAGRLRAKGGATDQAASKEPKDQAAAAAAPEPPKALPAPPPVAAAPKSADGGGVGAAPQPAPAQKPPAPSVQPPPQAAPPQAAPPQVAPPQVAADSDPKASVKQGRRYPPPAYAVIDNPLATLPRAGGAPAEALVVESVECSDEGNWLVAFIGMLEPAENGRARLAIQRRIALNNYPGEGTMTPEELKAPGLGFSCAAEGVNCSMPKKRISIAEHSRIVASDAAKSSDWRCAPDVGFCFSKQADLWRCGTGEKRCHSYDEARWWCVPRREFCFQGVPFGDWGSPFKEGDRLTVSVLPTRDAQGAPVKDANGHTVYENHVYALAHGNVRIAQDVLMRRCAGYSGPARPWASTFPTN